MRFTMKIKKTDGFTILEVMVGMIIFTLGMLLLSSLTVVALRGNTWSDKTSQVVQAMRDKIEDYRHADVADMINGEDAVNGLRRTWTFQDLSANLKEITVVVSWEDRQAIAKRCSTITYIQVGA
jgi:Tfp pilus assembly protein PilV